jgi:hypothetical protein
MMVLVQDQEFLMQNTVWVKNLNVQKLILHQWW